MIDREFVSLESTMPRAGAGGRPCQGVYHRPAGERPRTAVIATHYEVDFAEHYLADHLVAHGYGFLGWNHRFRGNGTYFNLEPALVDIGVGVRWLREQAGVETVVILGNSGGASLMAAYQAEAVAPTLGVDGLAAADLFISLNAHPGRPDVFTMWLDPSVTDENDPLSCDPDLDMFNEQHGPPYAPDFVKRYRAAQVARNDRITAWCHEELARLKAGDAHDRVFAVNRAWADLRFTDLTLDPSDRPYGCYMGEPRRANYSGLGLCGATTIRSWLSMWSLAESKCRAEPHLARITDPAFVMQSTADTGCFPSDARVIHDALASADKTLELVPGDHYFLQPDHHRPEVAARLARWMEDHGAKP